MQTTCDDDRKAIDLLADQFFKAVSFEPGEMPHYDTITAIFIESGLLIKNSTMPPEVWSVPSFIATRHALFRSGALSRFSEVELAEKTEIFGHVAQRFNAYAKTGRLNGADFAARGMISTQFVRTPQGWRMSSMAWDDERPLLSIPSEYGSLAASHRSEPSHADAQTTR